MTPIGNIRAAIAHLEGIAKEIEAGLVHDAERLAGDVRDFLHLGRSETNSRRGEAPTPSIPEPKPEAPTETKSAEEPKPESAASEGNDE